VVVAHPFRLQVLEVEVVLLLMWAIQPFHHSYLATYSVKATQRTT